jgi:hypothetical protein
MRYIGAYQLGDRISLAVQCRTAQAPVLPDDAPVATVYNTAGTAVASYGVPPSKQQQSLFARSVHLNRQFVVGRYTIRYAYQVSGQNRAEIDVFDIVGGGDPGGTVIAGYPFHRPHAEFHVLDLDSGELFRGRNPFV